jgi:hypothetical protein
MALPAHDEGTARNNTSGCPVRPGIRCLHPCNTTRHTTTTTARRRRSRFGLLRAGCCTGARGDAESSIIGSIGVSRFLISIITLSIYLYQKNDLFIVIESLI